MHRNDILLTNFFQSLKNHNHEAMAECYHPEATFQDIAFDLRGKKEIHAMWHMISETDLVVNYYQIGDINDRGGSVSWKADYTYRDTGLKVHNMLKSTFIFSDGLIMNQSDDCDARKWAIQALGPIPGLIAWLIPRVRRRKAAAKLRHFIEEHPQYACGKA